MSRVIRQHYEDSGGDLIAYEFGTDIAIDPNFNLNPMGGSITPLITVAGDLCVLAGQFSVWPEPVDASYWLPIPEVISPAVECWVLGIYIEAGDPQVNGTMRAKLYPPDEGDPPAIRFLKMEQGATWGANDVILLAGTYLRG